MIGSPTSKSRSRVSIHVAWPWVVILLVSGWGWVSGVQAQGVEMAGRPIADVRVRGLTEVPNQLVFNQLRAIAGDPYNPEVVREDIIRVTHLGRFGSVRAEVQPGEDGSVLLTYVVEELALINDVQVVGNKRLTDQELLGQVLLRAGDPRDEFLINQGMQRITQTYEQAGYYFTEVDLDRELLDESGILIFRIREGPRSRVRAIHFDGNDVFPDKQLYGQIRSKTYLVVLRKGVLSRQQLDEDAARIREFYRDRGYLDAQVGRRIDLSPDQLDAVVTFLVEEGRLYTVDKLAIEGNTVFGEEQVFEAIPLRPGEPFSSNLQQRSERAILEMYGELGFIETRVQIDRLFHEIEPQVDLVAKIDEGQAHTVGTVSVRGNRVTKDKVIYREVRGMTPGRLFDRAGIEETERRLRESSLFSDSRVTLLGDRTDTERDVLIEVKETNTGTLSFGAGISSDAGLLGAIDVVQRNFDISNPPEKFTDMFTGKGFRGAGQTFSLALQPGDEQSRYSVSFREPHVLESDNFGDVSAFFFEREREDWDEDRAGGGFGLGRRFGDVWSGSVRFRLEEVEITDIEDDAPVDVFEVEGSSQLTSIGLFLTRNTTDSRVFPTEGSRTTLELSRAGALGGDYDYTRANVELHKFWTVDEDFLGRKTIVSARVEAGHIIEDNEAPLFERFYAGGHRTFRGFELRGAGPRGIRADNGKRGDDPVGGEWMFLMGLEYNFPIYQDLLRMVVFTDTGTIGDDVDLDDYRVSIGAGIRLKIPFLGQAPFALDFAAPIVKEDGDQTQVVSFDLALPF